MGLDCYIRSTPKKTAQQVDLPDPAGYCEEVAYWRGNWDIHEWMKNLYFRKGGENSDFNGVKVQLSLEDIIQLIRDVMSSKDDFTSPYSLHPARDLAFVPEILEALSDGKTLFYLSSW